MRLIPEANNHVTVDVEPNEKHQYITITRSGKPFVRVAIEAPDFMVRLTAESSDQRATHYNTVYASYCEIRRA
jgi:hypothetical protein